LFLYAFDPTITAHAQLVTTDVPCALFSTLFFFLLYRYVERPSVGRLLAAGVSLGLGLGAKFSGLFLLPLAALTLGTVALGRWAADRRAGIVAETVRLAGVWVLLLAVASLVVWALYFFPADPLFYWHGLRTVESDHDPRYLHFFRGELRHEGWLTYFLVAWLVKTPLPAILLILAAAIAALRGFRRSWIEEAFLAIPLVGFFILYSSHASPIGIRYVIPCFQFLMIGAGRIAPMLAAAPRSLQAAAVAV
jgi:4-amino-4-deoxy-L-arabinose transferase-like glycosyltransferase